MSVDELASEFEKGDADIVASFVEEAFHPDIAALVFNSPNLSESKAEAIWHSTYLSDTKRNAIGSNLSPTGISKVLYFGEEATWKTVASPSTTPSGIGGDSSVIWHCDTNADQVYELSTTDFSVVRSASSPNISPSGIGGDPSVIWHCDADADQVYQLGI